MNLQNPTLLKIGMSATFLEREYILVGRVVMGVEVAGEFYFWNEFNLESADGSQATLVYESDEQGFHWRIFTRFEPEFPMTASDAASKRLGDIINLTGTDLTITLVETSTVHRIEGRAPADEWTGSQARYFNAEFDQLMQVVSWTREEVEYYNGTNLSAGDVATAFGVDVSKLTLAASSLSGNWQEDEAFGGSDKYLGASSFWITTAAVVGVLALIFLLERGSRGVEGQWVQKESAPAAPLSLGAAGTLKNVHYTILAHEVIEVSEQGLDFERHEYALMGDDGRATLLVCGLTPGAHNWEFFTPFSPVEPITPLQAGALQVGQTVNIDGLQVKVSDLFLTQVKQTENIILTNTPATKTLYGFDGKTASETILARWDASQITWMSGKEIAPSEVTQAFTGPY